MSNDPATNPLPSGCQLAVVSGPAGSGKNTLVSGLIDLADGNIREAVSATTRRPRPGEINGEAYHFISHEQFRADIAADRFAEYAEFGGNLYGTPTAEIDRHLAAGHTVLLVIEVQGGAQIRKLYPEALHIFVLPPTHNELRARLEDRGTETVEEREKRLSIAENEIRCLKDYDFLIINDDEATAIRELQAIITTGKGRRIKGGERKAWSRGEFGCKTPNA